MAILKCHVQAILAKIKMIFNVISCNNRYSRNSSKQDTGIEFHKNNCNYFMPLGINSDVILNKKYLVTLPSIIYVSCSKSYAFQWHKHLLKFFHATYGSIITSMYDKTNTTMIMFRHIFILRNVSRAVRHTEYVNIMKKYDILDINVDLKFRPLKPCHISKCYQVACSPNTI